LIKAIIFDLDDTLYNEKEFVHGAFDEVAEYLGLKYNISRNLLLNEMIDILLDVGRGKIFNLICEKHGIKESIDTLVNIYRNSKPNIKLYPDSIEILSKAKNKYKLGLITDGLSKVQWNKIKILNLDKYFDQIIVTDDFGKDCWKPNTFAYNAMINNLKLKANECIYVGDNPNKDFCGARTSGYTTVRILRKDGDYYNLRMNIENEADFKIEFLTELSDILLNLNKG
jgi:putative hydrolase of the HAD superfamily